MIIVYLIIFFVVISIFGFSIYSYFHTIENKVIRKDKYFDDALHNPEKKRFFFVPESFSKLFTHLATIATNQVATSIILKRLLLLYGTYVGLIAFFLFGVMYDYSHGDIDVGLLVALISIAASPIVLFIFPSGFTLFFNPKSKAEIIGYLVYITIIWFAIYLKEHRSFIKLYVIFVIILIMNIVGCSRTDLSGFS